VRRNPLHGSVVSVHDVDWWRFRVAGASPEQFQAGCWNSVRRWSV
jgi:hypothetical protein